jgi:hypothetical protein
MNIHSPPNVEKRTLRVTRSSVRPVELLLGSVEACRSIRGGTHPAAADVKMVTKAFSHANLEPVVARAPTPVRAAGQSLNHRMRSPADCLSTILQHWPCATAAPSARGRAAHLIGWLGRRRRKPSGTRR